MIIILKKYGTCEKGKGSYFGEETEGKSQCCGLY